jgi:hypothetical protein
MEFFRFAGVFTLIPATMFLVISFFILFAVSKIESERMKRFGRALAILLWVCSALVFFCGVTLSVVGPQHVMHHKMAMLRGGMEGMPCMKDGKPCVAMDKNGPMVQKGSESKK